MRRLFASGTAVIALSLIAQLISLVRGLLLIAHFGASSRLDAFHLANNATFAVFNVIDAAILTVLIPELVKGTPSGALRRYMAVMMTGSLVASAGIMALMAFGGSLVAPGFDVPTRQLLQALVAVLLIGQQFRAFTSLFTAVQQVQERFTPPKVAAILAAATPLVYLLVYSDLIGFCVVTALSYLAEALLNGWSSRRGDTFTLRGLISGRNEMTATMLKETYPVLLSTGLFQIQVIVTTVALGRFGEGTITHYANAGQVVGALQALLLANLLSMLYPRIAAWVHSEDANLERRTAALAILLNGLIIFLFAMFLVAGREALDLLFLHGNATPADTQAIFDYSVWLFLVLPASAVRDVLYRVAYAKRKSSAAGRNSLIIVVFNIILLLVLVPKMGVIGVFVSTLVGSLLSVVTFTRVMKSLGFAFPWSTTLAGVAVFALVGLVAWSAAEATTAWHAPVIVRGIVAAAVFALLGGLLARRYANAAGGHG